MEAQIKELWVRALESDKYPQGKELLNFRNQNFCCLGVLCEVLIDNGYKLTKATGEEGRILYGISGQSGYLPGEVIAYTGIMTEDPQVDYNGRITSLADLNDAGTPFKDIAQLVRKQF